MSRRRDPGPCPVCGEAHTACTAGDRDAVTMTMLPARDRVPGSPLVQTHDQTLAAALVKNPNAFSTRTYERAKHGRRAPRGRR